MKKQSQRDQLNYSKGDVIKTFTRLEPRFSLAYQIRSKPVC